MSFLCDLWFTWISSSGLPTWLCFYENNYLTALRLEIRNCPLKWSSKYRSRERDKIGTALLLPLVPVDWGKHYDHSTVYRTNYFDIPSFIFQRPGPGLIGISMFTLRYLAHRSVSSTLSLPTRPSHMPFVWVLFGLYRKWWTWYYLIKQANLPVVHYLAGLRECAVPCNMP